MECENLLNALRAKDNFDQPPILASFNAFYEDKAKETTAEFLLSKILELDDDQLTHAALFQRNKTNDSVLTELFMDKDIYAKAIKLYFKIFTKFNEKKRSHSKGFYQLVVQMMEDNSLKLNSTLMGQIIFEIKDASRNFLKEENKMFYYKNPCGQNVLMRLATDTIDDALREILVNTNTYR